MTTPTQPASSDPQANRLYTLFALKAGENVYRRLSVDKPYAEVSQAARQLGHEWVATVMTIHSNERPSKWWTTAELNQFRRKLQSYRIEHDDTDR